MKNIHTLDRYVRLGLGIVLLELAYFWLGSPWQWVAYALAAVALGTSAIGFCPLYRVLGIGRSHAAGRPIRAGWTALTIAILLTLLGGGSYASIVFTRKLFLEDFNAMNHFYKQTLFLTGKSEREQANANFDQLRAGFGAFQNKYSRYHPYALKSDQQLASDLQSVGQILTQVEPGIRSGDLHQAHLDLEKVRPVFQDIFKRNGFSMLSVALVDFHDAMELMLDAAHAKDAGRIASLAGSVGDKLKAVEAEANDAEIQAIRKNLDELTRMAQQGGQNEALPAQAEALKSSFIKVYLKRG